jgi:hypothetical protein
MLQAITPWLGGTADADREPAARTRRGGLIDQRSCLIAPLIAQHEMLIPLRRHRRRLRPLDDPTATCWRCWRRKRPRHLPTSLRRGLGARWPGAAELERRGNELAIINSVQQAWLPSSTWGIVDLVATSCARYSSRRYQHRNVGRPHGDGAHALCVQHGARSTFLRTDRTSTARCTRALQSKRPVIANNRAEMDALGCAPSQARDRAWRRP